MTSINSLVKDILLFFKCYCVCTMFTMCIFILYFNIRARYLRLDKNLALFGTWIYSIEVEYSSEPTNPFHISCRDLHQGMRGMKREIYYVCAPCSSQNTFCNNRKMVRVVAEFHTHEIYIIIITIIIRQTAYRERQNVRFCREISFPFSELKNRHDPYAHTRVYI